MQKRKNHSPNQKMVGSKSKTGKPKDLAKTKNQRIFNIVRLPYGKSSKIRVVNPSASVKIPIEGLLQLKQMVDLEKDNGLATINIAPIYPKI